jgi:hypothetical protein
MDFDAFNHAPTIACEFIVDNIKIHQQSCNKKAQFSHTYDLHTANIPNMHIYKRKIFTGFPSRRV